jgi:hypothetical protein
MMTAITTKGAAAYTGVIWTVLLLAAFSQCTTPSVQAADSPIEGAMILAPTTEMKAPMGNVPMIAPGAAEDTLKACMARIPELASVGQHLLAERSCAREEATRKTMRSALSF